MNKPLAIGLIIFFILVIAAGAIWLTVRPAPETPEPERGLLQRFSSSFFGPGAQAPLPAEIKPAAAPEKRALTLLSAEPVAGFAVLKNGVRFIERQTGHVSDIGPQGQEQTRISNTTIPKIFQAQDWSPDASRAILKYFIEEDARIIAAEFKATSTQAAVLPAAIISSAWAPDRDRIAYLLPAAGGSRTIIADPDNGKQNQINSSPFQDWEIWWPEKNTLSYLSRPSGIAPGFLFKYDLAKGTFEKIIGDIPGLEIKWASGGQKILYSSYNAGSQKPQLFAYDLKTGLAQDLQTQTLAAKCVFGKTNKNKIYCGLDAALPQALWPDQWLQGAASTLDIIWEINLETGEKKIINGENFFDVNQIDISADDQFLYFGNKYDNSLWSLKLTDS
jgi:dipeptidyl aminopeptidase/acylaminoacyl peptidase